MVFLIEEEKKEPLKSAKSEPLDFIVKFVFSRQTSFFECKHPFFDKTDGFFYQNEGKDMTISQPSSILYPGNKQYKFVKSLSCLCQNRTSERKL